MTYFISGTIEWLQTVENYHLCEYKMLKYLFEQHSAVVFFGYRKDSDEVITTDFVSIDANTARCL